MSARETFGNVPRPPVPPLSTGKKSAGTPATQAKRPSDKERFSDKATHQYRQKREALLPRLLHYHAQLALLPSAALTVDDKHRNECKLTEEGVRIHLDPESTEDILYRRLPGVLGTLPLEIADLITVAHLVGLAEQYGDPSFFIEPDRGGILEKSARKYFTASINDTVIDCRLTRIPLFARYFDAFYTRILAHDMRELPLHVQYINALRCRAVEAEPTLMVAAAVQEALDATTRTAVQKTQETVASQPDRLFDAKLSYRERHTLADQCLYPTYLSFLKEDRRKFDFYSLGLIYAELSFFNTHTAVTLDDLKKRREFDETSYVEEIYQITEEHADKTINERLKEADVSSDEECSLEVPGLILPRRDASSDTLEFTEQILTEYYGAVRRWHATISDVADLFLRLATPKESITVPRYRFVSAPDGVRINPRALVDAHIQLQTNSPRPIWQPLIKEVRHQELQLSGLDIFILLDVSASMGGVNAEYASAMAVCLIEGLQVARYRAEAEAMQGSIDVRTQLLAFGASWAELTSLCKEPTPEQKETAFYHLMNPSSNITQINGALKYVRQSALRAPGRDIICLVVSDGLFSDNFEAFMTVKEMPSNVYVGHISIGNSRGIPITPHYEKVYDPKVLPKRLYLILEEYLKTVLSKS